jgi:hypothetical protein
MAAAAWMLLFLVLMATCCCYLMAGWYVACSCIAWLLLGACCWMLLLLPACEIVCNLHICSYILIRWYFEKKEENKLYDTSALVWENGKLFVIKLRTNKVLIIIWSWKSNLIRICFNNCSC